jgi:hypothetical protein
MTCIVTTVEATELARLPTDSSRIGPFWKLDGPRRDSALATWTKDVRLERVICPQFPGHQRPGRRLTPLSVVLPTRLTVSNASGLIDPQAWDGSDFFMVWPLPRFVFVTDRVVQIIRAEEFTGVDLTEVTDLEAKSSTLSPGRLSHWFPEARANELGASLESCRAGTSERNRDIQRFTLRPSNAQAAE